VRLKETFAELRSSRGNIRLPDFHCFAVRLQDKVRYSGLGVLNKAIDRFNNIQALGSYVFPKLKTTNPTNQARYESGILREIINFEIRDAKRRGRKLSLDEGGISQVVDDYMLLRDYHLGVPNHLLQNTIRRFGISFLTPEENATLAQMSNKPREEIEGWMGPLVTPRIKPFVYFARSLCGHLQEQENPLTPTDAYWLGAVDEIVNSGLPCVRQFVESQQDDIAQTPDLPNVSVSPTAPPPPSELSPPSD
jgi:hypothetical protein